MTKRDEELLASVGMTVDDVDEIAQAIDAEDYSMWDSSRVSYGNAPLSENPSTNINMPVIPQNQPQTKSNRRR